MPEVEQKFESDVAPWVAGLEEAIAAAERFRDAVLEDIAAIEMFDEVLAGQAGAAADSAEATARAADAAGDDAARAAEAAAANAEFAGAAGEAARATAEEAVANTAAAASAGDAARAATEQAAATHLSSAASAEAAKTAYLLAMAERMQSAGLRDVNTAAQASGRYVSVTTGFWQRWGTVIHWVIAGGSEFLAVFVPAMVAGGAAAAVMAQGVTDVTDHLKAMYTAQEATANIFHTTTGEMVGMKSVLQQAQDAADPRIFELLGAGINVASHSGGEFVRMGVQVITILDQFAAKATADLTGAFGDRLTGLLSSGSRDLAGLGAMLGNLGHAVVNLAADMPGLAEVLLAVFDGATRLLAVLSGMPGMIITVAMGFEEFARWGSLVTGILGRMTGASTQATGAWYHLWGNALIVSQNFVRVAMTGFANVASGLGNMMLSAGQFAGQWGASMRAAGEAEMVLGEDSALVAGETTAMQDALYTTGAAAQVAGASMVTAGAEIDTFAAQVQVAIDAITPFEALLAIVAAVGLGILVDKAVTAKNALDKFADSMNNALRSASNLELIPKIAGDIASADAKMAAAQQQYTQALADSGNQTAGVASRLNGTSAAAYGAALSIHQLAVEHQYLSSAMENVLTGAGMLAREYSTTFTGALAIAQGAGVNLTQSLKGNSQAAADARLQIANYVAGMQAMGETSTAVGHDVTLLGINSELTGTKIQQLNQAVDSFVSNMTGGTAGLGALAQSVLNVGQAIGTTTGTLSDSTNGMNLSLGQIQHALTNFGDTGSQVWENFDQALAGSAEQLADWFRTAGAEGAIGSGQFTKGMQDIVAQFVPFAKDSKTAQQELVGFAQAQGLNVQTFPQLVAQLKSAGASGSSLAGIVAQTTGKMADMNQIAQALGASLGTDVVGAMNNARLAASGLTGAAQNLAGAWNNAHQVNNQVEQGFEQTVAALYRVYGNTNMAIQAADAYARALGLTQSQVNQLNRQVASYASELSHIPRNVNTNITVTGQITGSGAAALAAAGISNTTIYHVRPMGGAQLGAAYVPPGVHQVGEAGPELVKFRGGESVTPAWRTAPMMRGAGVGGGAPPVVHSHVYIDGREVFTAVQDQTYAFNRRNGLAATGSLAPPG